MAKRRGLSSDPLGDALRRATPRGLDAIVPDADDLDSADGERTQLSETMVSHDGGEVDLSTDRQADQSTYQLIDQSTDLSTVLSTNRSTDQPVRRPVAFYLTERQDETLTVLVEYFRRRYRIKTDRSALLRAILREPVLDFYSESTHEELIKRLTDDAAMRLLGRAGD